MVAHSSPIQVTDIEAGTFSTDAVKSMVSTEAHPSYSKPTLVGNRTRDRFSGNAFPPGTPPVSAAAKIIYELTDLKRPPSHLPLGIDAVEAAKKKYAALLANAEKVASWSEGLVA